MIVKEIFILYKSEKKQRGILRRIGFNDAI